jgi:hypothetical protein
LVGKPEEKRSFGRPVLDGRIILEWILEKRDGNVWIGFIWLRIWTRGGLV